MQWQQLSQRFTALSQRALAFWQGGIWSDTRQAWWLSVLKTINISVRSFLDADLQSQACALTYRTALAIVPALAMIFAIGRGFGFQSLLQDELYSIFPGQREAVNHSLTFVDQYLSTSSEGIFVGIGLLFLLWTVIALLSSVETTFNRIWGVKEGRSFWRKISDYTAIMLILPLLMICAGGISIFLSSALQHALAFRFMTPLVTGILEGASWLFTWLFFCGVFLLIPNTKVRFRNAAIAGVIAGTAFKILQWLFVSGQLYVTKYNAIYGSFAFLPLLLIWIQLTWMCVLCGCLLCYSSQNIFMYAFSTQVSNISPDYRKRVTVAVTAVIAKRFNNGQTPLTATELIHLTDVPPRLMGDVLDRLVRAGVLVRVLLDVRQETVGYQPAVETSALTLGLLRRKMGALGRSNFIPGFDSRFASVTAACRTEWDGADAAADTILLTNLDFNLKDTTNPKITL